MGGGPSRLTPRRLRRHAVADRRYTTSLLFYETIFKASAVDCTFRPRSVPPAAALICQRLAHQYAGLCKPVAAKS